MSFQSTVNTNQAFGVPGEFATDNPKTVDAYVLDSAIESNNVFGRAFTIKSEGVAQAGGTGVFAGLLVNPKEHALKCGLTPSLSARNGDIGAFAVEGDVIVTVSAAANIGASLKFSNADGKIGVGVAGDGETALPAVVVRYNVSSGGGLAIARLKK